MANLQFKRLLTLPTLRRVQLILISPLVIILLGQAAARTLGPLIGVWSWLPLNMGYWLTVCLLVAWLGGRRAFTSWLQPSQGGGLWPFLGLAISILPTVPMMFPDSWRLFQKPEILLSTVLFVLINPLAEEAYWRGLLLSTANGSNKWVVVLYSSLLFTVNHMWITVIAIGARNPMASIFQLIFGLLMCIIYLKTKSLRWPLVAHFLTNLLTPTVAVFLNLYIPGSG